MSIIRTEYSKKRKNNIYIYLYYITISYYDSLGRDV